MLVNEIVVHVESVELEIEQQLNIGDEEEELFFNLKMLDFENEINDLDCTCGLENRSYWADFPNKSLICQNHAPGAPTAAASPHGRRTANQTP